jgi:site-specific recombinase
LIATGRAAIQPQNIRERVLAASVEAGWTEREDLAHRFVRLLQAQDGYERLSACVRLVDWMREREPLRGRDGRPEVEGSEAAPTRLQLTLYVVRSDEHVRALFQETIARVLLDTHSENLYSQAGIPPHHGFLQELSHRVLEHVLPMPRDEHDLWRLMRRMFTSHGAAERLMRVAPENFRRVVRLVREGCGPDVLEHCTDGMADGFRLLASRVQSLGLAADLRSRLPAGSVGASPFLRLAKAAGDLVDRWLAGEETTEALVAWQIEVEACRAAADEVHRRLTTEGVNLDIVYSLAVIRRALIRMEDMAGLMTAPDEEAWSDRFHGLVGRLALACREDASIGSLVDWNLKLLHQRIVERTGETGGHYVASDRAAYRHIWLAAAGGGAIITFTAAVKIAILGRPLSLFFEGLSVSADYACSFLLLQALGLILATKQPAMTAATLARLIREDPEARNPDRVVDFAARICSSQLAAAISNVVVVSIGALLFSFGWEHFSGAPYVDERAARELVRSLEPLGGNTALFAAFTGVLLWIGSVVGGWFENFVVYNEVARGIAEHPLGRRLGRERLHRIAESVERNAAGWGTNLSLAFLMGMVPVMFAFFGVHLEVRHVTLSTGMLAMASASLGQAWWHKGMALFSILGVLSMFVLNLSVSFLLSLLSACRAYGFRFRDLSRILWALLWRLLRRPQDFLFPMWVPVGEGPRATEPAAVEPDEVAVESR